MSARPVPDRPRPPSPDLLIGALSRLLRPLVRLLIQGGVTFPALADLLRSLYVEVALHDLLTDPQARTDSRVSLLTGVHRKEIRKQRGPKAEPELSSLTLSSKVIARWLASPAMVDEPGRPLPLSRTAFEALVASVTTDVRPRALLDEWLETGVATLDAEGAVCLERAAFVPRGDRGQQMFFFGRNLHDHIAAAAANVAATGAPPFLERTVHYDGLSAEASGALESAGREAAESVLLLVNRAASAIADQDDAASAGQERRHRVNFGVYVYREEERPRAED